MITYLSTTYLKGIEKYKYYQMKKDNMYFVIKKILDDKQFYIDEDGKDVKIIDKNYYILEVLPLNKNYICRIHLDDKKNAIEKYYVFSLKNNIVNNIPTFENLKLAYVCFDFQKKIYNEDYFNNLYYNNEIIEKDYLNIKNELNILIDEIKKGTNYIYNINYKELIEQAEE